MSLLVTFNFLVLFIKESKSNKCVNFLLYNLIKTQNEL